MRTLAAVLAGQLALSMVLASPAMASCSPARAHDNVARYVSLAAARASLTGVKAQIKEYDPFYSGSNGTGTNATVLLVRRSGGQVAWAQWGWFKSEIDDGSAHRQVGLEFYVSASDNRFHFWPGEPLGQMTEYKLTYAGGGVYEFRLDGVRFDSESGIANPTEYQAFGETHDRADQMPGGSNAASHMKFSTARYYTGTTFVSHVITENVGTGFPGFYGFANPSDGNFEIWDKACAN